MKVGRLFVRMIALATTLVAGAGLAAMLDVEKDELKLGFIKLTDCAPLVIAKDRGFFEDEGLFVTLEAQANWKILLDRVISGELDGAHMLAGQPIGATIGIGTTADVIAPISLDLNGNAITVSKQLWDGMKAHDPALAADKPPHPISADALRPIVEAHKAQGTPLRMAMVFPVSTHNYELRYWLAAAGISPGYYIGGDTTGTTDADVLLSVTPPPQMPSTLEQGTIQGYCVGEPWNQQAVMRDIGVPVVTNYEIWRNNPEKVFGVTRQWAEANPNTLVALVKALIRAGQWLDADEANRREAVTVLARSEYVGADAEVIANSMTGTFEFARGDVRKMPDFNVFFRHHATYPYFSDAVWFLTQMRRWGQIADEKPDGWYDEIVRRVYRPDIYRQAAQLLIAEGHLAASDLPDTDGYKPTDSGFIDGVAFNAREPNHYLTQFAICIQGARLRTGDGSNSRAEQ